MRLFGQCWSEAAWAANALVVAASRLTPSLASSAETVPAVMPLFAAAASAEGHSYVLNRTERSGLTFRFWAGRRVGR